MSNNISQSDREKSKLTKEEWRDYTKTVWQIANTSHPSHPAVFPVEIPKRLIKLFSWHGERVLDPFAGTGTTAQAAIPLGRRIDCVEQNAEFAELIHKQCRGLKNEVLGAKELLHVERGDSRDLSYIGNEEIALVVTSPPYWNKANYGARRENLGNRRSYATFLTDIEPVFRECFRVLQSGRKLCLVTANVNQHTEHGLLTFPLAADFIVMLREIGFVLINEIIWSKDGTGGKWGSSGAQRPIFGSYPYPPNLLFKNVHEYIIIVAKPPRKPTSAKTVVPYDFLMGRAH